MGALCLLVACLATVNCFYLPGLAPKSYCDLKDGKEELEGCPVSKKLINRHGSCCVFYRSRLARMFWLPTHS